jgi:hypothetical protein
MKDKIKNAQRLITDAQGGKANIKGKEYTTVPLRVEVFRSNLDDEDLKSSPNVYTHLKIFENRVISKTYLAKNIDIHLDEEGKEIVTMESVIAVGTAEELRDSSMINKTSAVENAETSSVGRMLANLGLHGGSYASFEEVETAIEKQNVVQLKDKKPIQSKDVTQHRDLSEEKDNLYTSIKTLIDTGFVDTKSKMNVWAVENQDRFEELRNNDLHNHSILVNDLSELRKNLPQEKGKKA